jgi:hypothetical protein
MQAEESLREIFEKIVNNKEFIERTENYVKEIMRDGKVDYHDIPEIVFLIVDTIVTLYDLEISEEDLKVLLKMILFHVFEKYGLIKNSNRFIFQKMIDTAVKLVVVQVARQKIKSWFEGVFGCC